jgi:hypothetical protein
MISLLIWQSIYAGYHCRNVHKHTRLYACRTVSFITGIGSSVDLMRDHGGHVSLCGVRDPIEEAVGQLRLIHMSAWCAYHFIYTTGIVCKTVYFETYPCEE